MSAEKDALRQRIRASRRQQLPSDEAYQAASLRLMQQLERHPRFVAASCVALYWSLPDEPSTHDFLERYWQHKTLLLPRVTGDESMELCHYRGSKSLSCGAFGILEPVGEVFTDYEALSLIVVPGVAFDANGYRMGRGRGYYDRFLSTLPPYIPSLCASKPARGTYRLGICFPFQVVSKLPIDPWDLPMDEVLC